jgi:curved DNA-binding protein CbpA
VAAPAHKEFDAYRVLQVDARAEGFVLEAAYRALARHYHPDGRTPNVERMAAVNRAYDLVRTPERRGQYDAERLKAVGPGAVMVPPTTFEPWSLRSAAKQQAEAATSLVLDFGRYTGWSLKEVARQDPDYLRWLVRHASGFRYRAEIQELLPEEPELHRRAKSVR